MINPYWIEDPELKKGEVDFLSQSETQFWKDLIDKYLYPIDANKEEQVSWILIYNMLCYTSIFWTHDIMRIILSMDKIRKMLCSEIELILVLVYSHEFV